MTLEDAADMVKRHEGLKDRIYLDTEGVLTGGWGHAFHIGSELPFDVCLKLFYHDFGNAIKDVEFIQKKFGLEINGVREGVLIDMAYQLGVVKLLLFKKMLAALCIEDYDEAAAQILNSKAAKQCPSRYKELAGLMKKGEVY
ncbi:MAG: hypothetical protein KKB31_07725 [Nanoarchaeota archaeon]|nr:hypothetical protein [Nanoarchaeota archaeon]